MTSPSADLPSTASDEEQGAAEKPSGGRSRLLLIVIGLIVIVAATLLFVWAGSSDNEGDPPPETPTGPVEPPSDGEVTVTDQGFVHDTRDGIGIISYGLEFSNTSSLVAVGVTLRVTFVDANGELLRGADDQSQWQDRDFTQSILLPGQTHGVGSTGRWAYLDDGTGLDPRMNVEVTVDEWWPIDSQPDRFRELRAFDVELKLTPPQRIEGAWPPEYQNQPPGDNGVYFRSESGFDGSIGETYSSGVFRGPDGDIVGGWAGSVLYTERQSTSPGEDEPILEYNAEVPPGKSDDTFIFPISAYVDEAWGILAYLLFDDAPDNTTASVYLQPALLR